MREVGGDHERPLPHAVDEEPERRRDEPGQREDEEDEPGLGVRPRQGLDPDPEHEVHRPVAEEREALTHEQEASVAIPEERPHRAQLPVAVGRIGKPTASTCTGAEPSGRRSGVTRSTYGCTSSTIASPTDSSSSGREVEERLARGTPPCASAARPSAGGRASRAAGQVALEDHRGQRRRGGGRLGVGADLLPAGGGPTRSARGVSGPARARPPPGSRTCRAGGGETSSWRARARGHRRPPSRSARPPGPRAPGARSGWGGRARA